MPENGRFQSIHGAMNAIQIPCQNVFCGMGSCGRVRMHGQEFKRRQDDAKKLCERVKERRNPSADVHEKPMSDGVALSIVSSWAGRSDIAPP
jgi:hypothetical protein